MSVRTFPISGPISLTVSIPHGSVTVETADELTETTVELTTDHVANDDVTDVEVAMQGSHLAVTNARHGGRFDFGPLLPWNGRRGVQVRVTVPVGTPVKINTVTAPIWIPGDVGTTDLGFGRGEAAVRHVAGDLRVRFGSGTVKAVRVDGSVQVRSGAGSAQLGEISGDLTVGWGSGELQAHTVHGTVRARSGSGGARLDEVRGDVDLSSGSGGFEIGLPAGVTARLEAHTGAGRVDTDLPVEDRPHDRKNAITVRARTGSGNIHVFRTAA